jgi:hypothetical protein
MLLAHAGSCLYSAFGVVVVVLFPLWTWAGAVVWSFSNIVVGPSAEATRRIASGSKVTPVIDEADVASKLLQECQARYGRVADM